MRFCFAKISFAVLSVFLRFFFLFRNQNADVCGLRGQLVFRSGDCGVAGGVRHVLGPVSGAVLNPAVKTKEFVCILIYYLSLWRWECCLCWVRFILVSDLFQQERGCILLLHTCKNYHVHLLFLNLLFLFYSVAAVLLLLCSGFVSPREALMRGPSRTKSSRCLLWKRASSESELPSRSESQTHPRWSAKPLLPEEDMHF
jgi:hypothetical protein